MKKRILAGLLAAALIFGLLGCQETPAPETGTTAPVETTVPAPEPAEVYAEARAALDSAAAVTLDVVQTVTTVVEDQSFVEESEQVLTYAGLNTDAPMVWLEEEVPYTADEEAEEENEETTRTYSEVYADGTLYVDLKDVASFTGSLDAEEYAERYVPAVLLDAALYEELTLETAGDETTIRFADPTAAESWALPEEAQLLDASGSAVIGADGKLQQMNYSVTYQYGSVEVTMDVESKPRAEALTVAVPEDADSYVPLQCVDALRVTLYSDNMLKNVETAHVYSSESMVTQAGGAVQSTYNTMDMHGTGEDLMMKEESTIRLASAQDSQQMVTESIYRDGKYVITVDDGVPTSQVGVKAKDVKEACDLLLSPSVATPDFWQDVTAEDLGSVYLLEYTYNEDFGNYMQNMICLLFWEDPTFLNSFASNYVNKEINGYLAIDKYTGLVTASGMYYEGVHTIEGDDYSLILQKDQSVTVPAFGAYQAITEEMPAEEAPEQKATPLFYHVTGEEGQEMWLLGTIHVGDERTGFLPQEIYDAFAASDALAMEIDHESFEAQLEEDESLQHKVSDAYYYSDGSTTEEHMDPELYELALKYMKASGNYNENAVYMKPFLWQSSIDNFFLQQGHQLRSEQGVEERLTELAKEQEKPIREVESTLFQIQMSAGWSEELQQMLLEDTLSYSAQEYWTETYELYELWCAGDEAALREEISLEEDLSELTEEELAEYNELLPLYEEYNESMSYDRNEGMLEVAIEYLESGEVIFYAVGLAHLLDSTNGLVDALREAGYTVELVTYYQ